MRKGIYIFAICLLVLGLGIAIHQMVQQATTPEELENSTNTSSLNSIENNTNTNKLETVLAEEKENTYSLPENSYLQTLMQQHLPVILYFTAEDCTHCVNMQPIWDSLQEKVGDKCVIASIDREEQAEETEKYPVRLVPTEIFVNADGTPYNGSKVQEERYITYYDEEGNHTLTTHLGELEEAELLEILKEMGMEE